MIIESTTISNALTQIESLVARMKSLVPEGEVTERDSENIGDNKYYSDFSVLGAKLRVQYFLDLKYEFINR